MTQLRKFRIFKATINKVSNCNTYLFRWSFFGDRGEIAVVEERPILKFKGEYFGGNSQKEKIFHETRKSTLNTARIQGKINELIIDVCRSFKTL